MRIELFTPIGNTLAMSISTSTESDPLSQAHNLGIEGNALRIFNAGPNTVHYRLGGSAVTAAIAVEDTPANGIPIPSGMVEVVFKGEHTYIAAICDTGESATIYMTTGDGA